VSADRTPHGQERQQWPAFTKSIHGMENRRSDADANFWGRKRSFYQVDLSALCFLAVRKAPQNRAVVRRRATGRWLIGAQARLPEQATLCCDFEFSNSLPLRFVHSSDLAAARFLSSY
jgi:hypothetical protein